MTLNEKVLINKTNFHVVFPEAFDKTMAITTIKSGFRVCGICPFNPNTIIKDRLMPSDTAENEENNKERENENENDKKKKKSTLMLKILMHKIIAITQALLY